VVKPAPALVLAKPGTIPVEVPAAPVVNSASKPEAPNAPTSGTDPATVPTVTAPIPAAASPAAEAKPRPATKRRSLRETLASEMVEMEDAKAASTPAARTPTRSTGEVRPPRSEDAEMPPASIAPRPNAASDGPPGSQRSRLAARLRSETVDFQSAREGRRETAPASDQLDRVTRPVLRRTTPKILPDPTPVAPVPLSGPAAEAKELLGVALEATRKKDFETARQLLQKALALNPEDRLVRYNLGLVGGKAAKNSTPAVPPAT
jgi:hypothetical protein